MPPEIPDIDERDLLIAARKTVNREYALKCIILDLVKKVEVYRKEYGNRYLGGRDWHYILQDIEELGIEILD